MTVVRELFSDALRSDPKVRSAMRGMTRGERLNLLCMTELREQLRYADPPLPPDMLPSFRLRQGSVLEPRKAAFRSRGLWYDLAFRCEADEFVTRIVKFSYQVGDAVPRSQWLQRDFPSF